MDAKHKPGMISFHDRAAAAYRQILDEPKKRSAKERARLEENEQQALAMAAKLRQES